MGFQFRHFTVAALLAQAAVLLASVARATVPEGLTEQGRLFDSTGNPLDATVALTFSLYSTASGGTALWTETQPSVVLDQGYFSAELGGVTPIPQSIWSGATLYAGVAVNSDPEMDPRQPTYSVPYALVANDAVGAIHPTTVSVNGQLVINANGSWVGPSSGLVGPTGPAGATGPPGAAGETGATGPMGPQGPAGATGAQGANGMNGAPGTPGAQGPQGPEGANGVNGATGTNGATGATGPSGAEGEQGPQGPAGATGAQGAIGSTGAQGATGGAGPQGATGAQGAIGAQGAGGTAGSNGAQGAAGGQGPAGAAGAQGSIGAAGTNGAQGADGPPGPAGPVGPAGSNYPTAFGFTNQTGVPLDSLITSNPITVAGFVGPATATCGAGCTGISRNGGAFSAGPVTGFDPGDTLAIQQLSPATLFAQSVATVGVGGTLSGPWTLTTGTPTYQLWNSGSGGLHGCLLKSSTGAAYCWGYNGYDAVGNGTTTNQSTPAPVSGGLSFTSISAAGDTGPDATCAVTGSGAAYCWGYNAYGQLGNGTTTSSSVPVPVSGGLSFSQISTNGSAHTCGITTAGAAYCWGANGTGALGVGNTTNSSTPELVAGGFTWKQIVTGVGTGFAFTCGLTTSSTAYCWGYNGYGELGNGTGTGATLPVAVGGGLTFTSLTAGYVSACGVTTSGAAYCWGDNGYGQLGNGNENNTSLPVAVSGGLTFQSLAFGYFHVCGVATSGAAYCWGGDAAFGELGNGTTNVNQTTPTPVLGGYSFVEVASGFDSTCGVTSTNGVVCWGYNAYGELGNGTTTNSDVPVAVSNLP